MTGSVVAGYSTSERGSSAALRIAHVVPRTEAEGPGVRVAVWAQGCSIRCSGCFNPHLWGASGGREVSVDELAAEVLDAAAQHGVEGITLLGGEPFDQAEGFARLCRLVRRSGLTTMVFTGHQHESLAGPDAPADVGALLGETDLLVDGPYVASLRDHARPWVGSRNQRFLFLTERYAHLEQELGGLPDRLEVRVARDGTIALNGWAGVDQLDELLSGVAPVVGRGSVR